MRKLKEALRLAFIADQSHRHIAATLELSKGVVSKYVSLAKAAKLQASDILELDEADLEQRLFPRSASQARFLHPDWGHIHQELRRKGMTLMLLWQEYCAQTCDEHDDKQPLKAWSYSQFCTHYRHFARSLKRSMRQTHCAGEKLFIDFAGPTVELGDGSRGHIFVAALGASGYCFAMATAGQKSHHWLQATARALEFIHGVPQLIVPDNPRALVAHADRYEPRLNDTVLDFARHYGCSVLPARAYHPQDKAKVELSVLLVERWILARLRHQRLSDLASLNEAIEPLLEQLNHKPFQKLPGCRASAFETLDKPALQPLPEQAWEWASYKTVRVHIDSHVEFEAHRYSVPHALVGQRLELRVTERAVEVLHRGQRVASHARCAHAGSFTTVPAHLPERHQAHAAWTPERLQAWAQRIGVACAGVVQRMLARQRHPEHAYRGVLGLLALARRYGEPRLEAACALALSLGTSKYTHIRDMLANRRDQLSASASSEWHSPAHEHLRGPGYYQ